MNRKVLAVIGVGNMAKAILNGILNSNSSNIEQIILFDVNKEQYASLSSIEKISFADSVEEAVVKSDSVLLSVKPQNYSDVLKRIKASEKYQHKLYVSIGAGISTKSVCDSLGGADVVRVLPNLPMVIGKGVSVICRNPNVSTDDFKFVKDIFASSGSIVEIDENEMNRIIGVTSSSPAYVFKFIDSIYQGALQQGISSDGLLDAVCDVVIGSALMVKYGDISPAELSQRVASKGGTTEKAIETLDRYLFSDAIIDAMKACTDRADELGALK